MDDEDGVGLEFDQWKQSVVNGLLFGILSYAHRLVGVGIGGSDTASATNTNNTNNTNTNSTKWIVSDIVMHLHVEAYWQCGLEVEPSVNHNHNHNPLSRWLLALHGTDGTDRTDIQMCREQVLLLIILTYLYTYIYTYIRLGWFLVVYCIGVCGVCVCVHYQLLLISTSSPAPIDRSISNLIPLSHGFVEGRLCGIPIANSAHIYDQLPVASLGTLRSLPCQCADQYCWYWY